MSRDFPRGGLFSPTELQRRAAKARHHAVQDVLTRRQSLVTTAAIWGVRVADLQRWVDEARGEQDR